ncbi:MAG: peptidoglycan-binding protein [Lachnospiraceae bacterium]|nr:peptidoglycan-binding protein [Lachnospiraceae bacterium]
MKKATVKTEVKKAPAKKAPVKKEPAKKRSTIQDPIELPTMTTFPTVKKGDSNGYVTLLQTNLQNRGYYSGKVDGKFGDKTEKAVLEFQKDLKKPLNGSVGPKTWEALQKSNVVKVSEKKETPSQVQPSSTGVKILIEGLSRYQADLLVKLLSGHTECRIL